jgi:glycosyltransferase involved in cell wall biosynthesis
MSRIFIAGMSPLPFENDRKVYGTGIRTWQFLLPLLEEGHKICVCNYAVPSAYPDGYKSEYRKNFVYSEDGPADKKNSGDSKSSNSGGIGGRKAYAGNSVSVDGGIKDNPEYSFEYNILRKEDFENVELMSRIFNEFKPDCAIGCTFYPSYILSKLISYSNKDIPFRADLFGHVMAEAQARAYMDGSDECLFHYWNSEYNIISAADVFSCVSSRQKYALIGELGAAGRLNRYTAGYNFTDVIPCGIPETGYRHTRKVIRGKSGIKEGDFVVLWTGGYNTWTDVDTLFRGLIIAMKKNPDIKFVSTGGEIPEQDLKTYPHFLSMVNESFYKDRFIMKGWVPGEDVPNYYLEADAGINIDKDIYEVRLGSKNRIMDWFRAGLCVLSSNVCELTDIIEKEEIGYTFKPYDYKELSDKLVYMATHRREVGKTAAAGKIYALKNFNFSKTTLRLREWVRNPVFSPDKGKEKKLFLNREEALRNIDEIAFRQKQMIEERDRRISELEGIVSKNLIYKIYSYFKVAKRRIFH